MNEKLLLCGGICLVALILTVAFILYTHRKDNYDTQLNDTPLTFPYCNASGVHVGNYSVEDALTHYPDLSPCWNLAGGQVKKASNK
jgi:hypothetical protein